MKSFFRDGDPIEIANKYREMFDRYKQIKSEIQKQKLFLKVRFKSY